MTNSSNKHFNKEVLLIDSRITPGVVVGVSHWLAKRNEVVSIFKIHAACTDVQVEITPAQARELAAKLIAHADEVEVREAALIAEELELAA